MSAGAAGGSRARRPGPTVRTRVVEQLADDDAPDGTREKWLRSKVGTNEAWRAENGSEIGWFIATTWDNVIERGTVTLGWDE